MCIISSEYAPRIAASMSACEFTPFLVYRTVMLSSPGPITDEPASAFAHMRAAALTNAMFAPPPTVSAPPLTHMFPVHVSDAPGASVSELPPFITISVPYGRVNAESSVTAPRA